MLDVWVVLGSDMAALIVARAPSVELTAGTGAAETKDGESARTARKTAEIMVGVGVGVVWVVVDRSERRRDCVK